MSVGPAFNITEFIDRSRLGALQWRVCILCSCIALFDGFDTQIVAYMAPAISMEWALGRGAFGPVFGAGLLGLTLGAIAGGSLADAWGRRGVIIAATAFFAVFATAAAWAQNLDQLIALRLLTGLGLGAAIPNLIALTSEFAPARSRALIVTLMFSGFPLGSVIGGFLSAWWIPEFGWRSLFYLGGLAPLAFALLLTAYLPESPNFLVAHGAAASRVTALLRRIDARYVPIADPRYAVSDAALRKSPFRSLFVDRRAAMTLLLWSVFFMNLLVMYFLVNWLPTLLMMSGYALSKAIMASSALNLGGIVGGAALAMLIRRRGPYATLGSAYALLAPMIVAVAYIAKAPALTFPAVFLLGFGVVGSQFCLNALAAELYPTAMRSTGIGWALGVGRIGSIVGPVLGGWSLSAGWSPDHLVLFCVVPTLLASAGVIALGHLQRSQPPTDCSPSTAENAS